MRNRSLVGALVAASAVVGLMGACDDGPTRPSRSTGTPTVAVTTTRLEIVGPDTFPPGESAQYSAVAHQSDGSTRDVTKEAQWRSGNLWVLAVSATGLATSRDRGDASIGVGLSSMTAWKNVIVVPTGTYRLVGAVRDERLPVPDPRVEVTSGTGVGLVAVTNSVGYRLYGVSGDIDVRVIAEGYQEQRKRLQVTNHQTLDFDLLLSRPRDEVAGTYTLTIDAAAECRAALPEEARSRTYTAVLKQDGPRLAVSLEGSKFVVDSGRTFDSFVGTVEPSRVTFRLNGYAEFASYLYLPDVLEQLTTSSLLSPSGSAATTVSPAGLSGTLDGTIETLQSLSPGRFQQVASCRSTGHRFVFSR